MSRYAPRDTPHALEPSRHGSRPSAHGRRPPPDSCRPPRRRPRRRRSPRFVDGRSLVPTFAGAGSGRQAFLIEFFAGAERDPEEEVSLLANETAAPPYRAIRTADRLYVDYQNAAQERELYALDADPFQLQSRHADPAFAAELDNLSAWLATLVDCAAAACRHAENAPRREPRPPHRP